MYRGIVELDANGRGSINLPDYFDDINRNVTYQLTSIGSPQQPYVFEEINNNQFKVGGAPNTKVSWLVIAERNDPYLQKYPEKREVEFSKEERNKGKYLMPDLYDQPESKSIFKKKEKTDHIKTGKMANINKKQKEN